MAYLDRLPVKEVKIDQSFVLRVEQGTADPTVLSATIGLAHDLGLRVVAEGVESEAARVLVRDLGVDLYQGYGLARPMTAPGRAGLARTSDERVPAPPRTIVAISRPRRPSSTIEIEASDDIGSARSRHRRRDRTDS